MIKVKYVESFFKDEYYDSYEEAIAHLMADYEDGYLINDEFYDEYDELVCTVEEVED